MNKVKYNHQDSPKAEYVHYYVKLAIIMFALNLWAGYLITLFWDRWDRYEKMIPSSLADGFVFVLLVVTALGGVWFMLAFIIRAIKLVKKSPVLDKSEKSNTQAVIFSTSLSYVLFILALHMICILFLAFTLQ